MIFQFPALQPGVGCMQFLFLSIARNPQHDPLGLADFGGFFAVQCDLNQPDVWRSTSNQAQQSGNGFERLNKIGVTLGTFGWTGVILMAPI
jgi:hypothetical protein